MNIQQLNQSGQQVHTFIITAFISMAITGTLWLFVSWVNHVQQWMRNPKAATSNEDDIPSYNIEIRLAILCYFLLYFDRMRHHQPHRPGGGRRLSRSRAWIHILLNSPVRRRIQLPQAESSDNDVRYLTAGELGAYCIRERVTWHKQMHGRGWDRLPRLNDYLGQRKRGNWYL